ncbi:hypothetical protein [Rubricoccus marinus]|uniref:General stress protein 17M-like domain-containing protein n=1 Tax=Rubricoccus marinus TaxID=716817 RepID=A0A259U027_9BACT|nr:hypothetical protein [Rubricoccus marinus]OZC03188.1 hypothetical protein BSZ36_09500 [Rubricoccus marinus]
MTTDNRPLVAGTFRDRNDLDRTVSDLRSRGYSDDDFHVVMSEDTRERYHDGGEVEIEQGSKAMEGAGAGAATGGTLGGIIGAIAGIGGAIIVPGIGAVAGPLAGALAGAGAGGAAGSLLGALVGAGIPEDQAKIYENDVKDGGMMLGVHPRTDEDRDYVQTRYNEYNADNVYTTY